MKAHVLQHEPFEDIGSMAFWLKAHDAEVSYTRFFDDAVLPSLDGVDLVIAMGGSMSVNDETTLPWLRPEKQWLREVIKRGVPVIGICLGAQLIASALGARVRPNAHKEIGWLPIKAIAHKEEVFQFPSTCTVFHWHGETFDLPDGAVHLARSVGCEHQAFQIGRKIIGLQFHLETTPELVEAMFYNCDNDLTPGPYVQTEAEMKAVSEGVYLQANRLMGQVLFYLTGV